MSRVSVAVGQKQKPKETFKFLRRDEGRLSYSTGVAESPSKGGGNGNETPRSARRDSKSLREAIAFDMRNAKSHDPLGDVVVAIPKKAPPPSRSSSMQPGQGDREAKVAPPRRAPSKPAAQAKRPEWVDPDIPVRSEPPAERRREAPNSNEHPHSDPYDRPAAATPRGGAAPPPLPAADRGYPEEYAPTGATPRRSVSAGRRYVDPEYEDPNYDRGYYRRPAYPPPRDYGMPPSRNREEDDLMMDLEQEVRAAQEERARYSYAKQQLDREKQRFDAYRFNTQQQLDDERAELENLRLRDQRDAQKGSKSAEERTRNLTSLLTTEREANRKLAQENESLRNQLEELTFTMRESQKTQKAEVARMRRDIESLTRRNSELLAMAKEQQLHTLEGDGARPLARAASSNASSSRPAPSMSYSREPSAQRGAPASASAPPAAGDLMLDADCVVEKRPPRHSNSPARTQLVMDFTPRSGDQAAKERRAKEMEERMRREEAEMQERRRQREQDLVDRLRAEEESEATRRKSSAAAAAPAVTFRREKVPAEGDTVAPPRKPSGASPSAAVVEKPVEERKASGHPATTPRMHSNAPVTKKKPLTTATTNASAPSTASHPRHYIPTREELIGDMENTPSEELPNDAVVSETAICDNPNKKEVSYRSGKREIHYANGTVKCVLPSGHTVLHFTNGDVKCTFPSGKNTYWYDAAQTMHTQMADGAQVFEFRSTGQTERHRSSGVKEILYPDGIFKVVQPDGSDETFLPDGQELKE